MARMPRPEYMRYRAAVSHSASALASRRARRPCAPNAPRVIETAHTTAPTAIHTPLMRPPSSLLSIASRPEMLSTAGLLRRCVGGDRRVEEEWLQPGDHGFRVVEHDRHAGAQRIASLLRQDALNHTSAEA